MPYRYDEHYAPSCSDVILIGCSNAWEKIVCLILSIEIIFYYRSGFDNEIFFYFFIFLIHIECDKPCIYFKTSKCNRFLFLSSGEKYLKKKNPCTKIFDMYKNKEGLVFG